MDSSRYTLRSDLLLEAEKIITQDRNKSYGEPDEDFQRIASVWSALGFRGPGDAPLTGHHVALAMIGLKMSRLTWSPTHRDSWVDIAGYAGCGAETAQLEADRKAEAEEPESLRPFLTLENVFLNGSVILKANSALTGDDSELKESGLKVVTIPTSGDGVCDDLCAPGHRFQAGCVYRVVHRGSH